MLKKMGIEIQCLLELEEAIVSTKSNLCRGSIFLTFGMIKVGAGRLACGDY